VAEPLEERELAQIDAVERQTVEGVRTQLSAAPQQRVKLRAPRAVKHRDFAIEDGLRAQPNATQSAEKLL